MTGNLQPLDQKFPIVTSNGTPTEYFIRWAQQRQIDIGEGITAEMALEIIQQYLEDHQLQAGSGIAITPSGNLSDTPTVAAEVQAILDQITNVRGSVLFRGAAGWEALAPGTSGQFLKTNGAGADPEWAAGGGGGGADWTIIHNATIPNPSTTIPIDVQGYSDILVIARLVSASVSSVREINVSTDGGSTYYTTSGDYVHFSDNGSETNTTGLIAHGGNSTAGRTIAGNILGINKSDTLKLSREIGGGRQRLFTANTDPITHIQLRNAGGGNMTGGTFLVMGR